MHVMLIPMFNKMLLLQKQMTKYTLDIFESPFVTKQSNIRNILNIFKSNSNIPLPYVLVEFEETVMPVSFVFSLL